MTRTDPLSLALDAAPPGSVALVAAGALARLLLAEAAPGGGGVLLPLGGGRHALVGVAAGTAARAAATMAETLGEAPRLLPLPAGAEALRAQPPATAPVEPGPRLRPLLDAEGVARAQFLSAGTAGVEAAARALLAGQVPLRPGLRLFLQCPATAQAAPLAAGPADDPRAPVAVLPLPALADPAALLAREAALRQAGWACGLLGEDPAALDWLADGPRWALAPPPAAPPATLPRRLVLLGPRPAWAPPWALHEGAA